MPAAAPATVTSAADRRAYGVYVREACVPHFKCATVLAVPLQVANLLAAAAGRAVSVADGLAVQAAAEAAEAAEAEGDATSERGAGPAAVLGCRQLI